MSVPHPSPISGASYSSVELHPNGDLVIMLDQRALPHEERYLELRDASAVAVAIRDMVVRGAPAISIAAAYGLAVEASLAKRDDAASFRTRIDRAAAQLTAARPTAVNLAWAVRAVSKVVAQMSELPPDPRAEAIPPVPRPIPPDHTTP